MILRSAAAPGVVPRQGSDGSWRLRTGAWQFHSAAGHEFERLEDARREMLGWTQKHAEASSRLSSQRCIALAETGLGTWRLWQVVRVEESLRQRLEAALRESAPADAAVLLRACAGRLLEARGAFQPSPPLPCRLELIGERRERPVYIGLLPPPGWEPPAGELALTDAELVRREIQPLADEAQTAALTGA